MPRRQRCSRPVLVRSRLARMRPHRQCSWAGPTRLPRRARSPAPSCAWSARSDATSPVRADRARSTSTATACSRVSNNDSVAAAPTIHVVAAALYDSQGRVLIAERPPGKHLAGRWEFPGGKIDAGETEETALKRELAEELGIAMRRARPLLRLAHDYDDRRIDISLWVVEEFSGAPSGLDGQVLKWVSP